jgi:uncharacterized protein (TIGR04255 family)
MLCVQRFHASGHALSDPHPSYPNPTIIQVSCEIAFAATTNEALDLSSLLGVLGKEFPVVQPVQNLQLQIVLGNQPSIVPSPPSAGVAFRFASTDSKRSVQVSKINFIYQWDAPYPNWPTFKKGLMALWSSCVPHLSPGIVTKLGLRYINRIPQSEDFPRLADWIRPTDDIPKSLLASRDHFLGRIESSPQEANLRLVTLVRETATPDRPFGSVIFDIDRIATEQFEPTDDAISEKLEFVHEDIWRAFDSATTDTLKALLSRGTA